MAGVTGAERTRAWRARKRAERLAAERTAEAELARARTEQLPLLPVQHADEAEMPRVGRPAGSVQRMTAEWRGLLLTKYRSPLIALAETYSRPVEELARALGCSRLEAFQLQQAAAKELAPYLHSKMPLAIQAEGAAMAPIVLAMTPGLAAQIPGFAGAPVPIIEMQQDQRVGEGEP